MGVEGFVAPCGFLVCRSRVGCENPGAAEKVRRRSLSSLAVVRRPLACMGSALRSAQKKSAHVLCVYRLSFGWERCFCLVQEGLRGHGEASAAGEDKGEGGEEVEHGEFHCPSTGLGIDGTEVAEVHHGDGHQHIEGHHGSGAAGEKTENNGKWSEDLTDQGAIGEEGGKAFGGKHALKEADAALEFGHAVEKHKAARTEAEQEQTDVRFATHE